MNRVGYGTMQLAGSKVWGFPDDPEARRVLRLAVELGVGQSFGNLDGGDVGLKVVGTARARDDDHGG
jgi:hypothetical protein